MLWVQLLCESFCRSRLWGGRLVRSWRTAGSGIPRGRSSAVLGRPPGCSPGGGARRGGRDLGSRTIADCGGKHNTRPPRSPASLGRPAGCSPVEGTSRDVLGAIAGEPGMLAGGGEGVGVCCELGVSE